MTNQYNLKLYNVLRNIDRVKTVFGETADHVIQREVRKRRNGHFNVASYTSIKCGSLSEASRDNAHVQFDQQGNQGMAVYRADAPSPYAN